MGSKKLREKYRKKKTKKSEILIKNKYLKRLSVSSRVHRDILKAVLRETENVYSGSESEEQNYQDLAQVREVYFQHLQKTIVDNYKECCRKDLPVECVEKLSLEIEQVALLASIQINIYQKEIMNIVSDIKLATRSKKVYHQIIEMLPKGYESPSELEIIEIDKEIKLETSPLRSDAVVRVEECHVDGVKHLNEEACHGEETRLSENPYFVGTDVSPLQQIPTIITSGQREITTYYNNDMYNWEGMQVSKPLSIVPPTRLDIAECDLHKIEDIETDKNLHKMEDENIERDKIALILEGEDSLEKMLNDLGEGDCLSPASPEAEEPQKLESRIEKMKELFGVEDESEGKAIAEYSSDSEAPEEVSCAVKEKQKPTIWTHEKTINLFRYFQIVREFSYETRARKQHRMVELFGEDSDDENEFEYSNEDRYESSCKNRMTEWIVKYLMPYYKQKRIGDRVVFKCLVKHIANLIYLRIQYPDQWTVRYYVNLIFTDKRRYLTEVEALSADMDDIPCLLE